MNISKEDNVIIFAGPYTGKTATLSKLADLGYNCFDTENLIPNKVIEATGMSAETSLDVIWRKWQLSNVRLHWYKERLASGGKPSYLVSKSLIKDRLIIRHVNEAIHDFLVARMSLPGGSVILTDFYFSDVFYDACFWRRDCESAYKRAIAKHAKYSPDRRATDIELSWLKSRKPNLNGIVYLGGPNLLQYYVSTPNDTVKVLTESSLARWLLNSLSEIG